MLLDNDDNVDVELNLIKNAVQQEHVCIVLVYPHINNVVSFRTDDRRCCGK